MTKGIEVITSVQRRRRWSRTEKERIVAAAMEPGAVVSEIARAAGVHSSQLFRWRQELCLPAAAPSFSPVAVLPETGAALAEHSPVTGGIIELDFGTGSRMRITGPVEASMVSALIKALAKTRRWRR